MNSDSPSTDEEQVPASILAPGNIVSHYRLIRECGHGGTGIVYEAEDIKLLRRVALKALKPARKEGPEMRARLLTEARIAARLHHQNVATIFAIEDTPAGVLVAMEFVEGKSLRSVVRDGPSGIPAVISIADQILDALSAAHELEIIHRDLKPENVMLTGSGRVKLLDFGLAKPLRESAEGTAQFDTESESYRTLDGHLVGTPGYIAPELVEGRDADVRTDIFSFGIILYELLTGRLCFDGRTPLERLMAVIADRPSPRARDVVKHVPRTLDRLILKCLDKSPEGRFSDVEKIRDAMELVKDEIRAGESTAFEPKSTLVTQREPTSEVELNTASLTLRLSAPSLPLPQQRRLELVANPSSNIPRPYLSYYGIHITAKRLVVDGEYHDITDSSTSFAEIDAWVKNSARFPQMIGTLAHEYARAFTKLQSAGGDILNIQSSKKLIRSYFAAVSASKTISARRGPQTSVPYIVDSGATDLYAGLLTLLAAQAREVGLSARVTARLVESAARGGHMAVSPNTLDWLIQSGRSPWRRRTDVDLATSRPLYVFEHGDQKPLSPIPRKRDIAQVLGHTLLQKVPAKRAVWAGVMHGGGASVEQVDSVADALRAIYDVKLLITRPLAPSTYLQLGPEALAACVLPVDHLEHDIDAPAPMPETDHGA